MKLNNLDFLMPLILYIIFANIYTINNGPFPHSTSVCTNKSIRLRFGWTLSYGAMVCWDAGKLYTGLQDKKKIKNKYRNL